MKRMNRLTCGVLLLAAVLIAAPAQALTFDLITDFDTTYTHNPNGVWSYGWTPSIGSGFAFNFSGGAVTQWLGSGSTNIWKNMGSGYAYGVAPGEVTMHPGSGGEYSVIRWISPFTGEIDLTGWFGAGDGARENYLVLKGSDKLFEKLGSYVNESFDLANISVNLGDAIYFAVGGWYGYGNTPIHATITGEAAPVPLPASILLLGPGLAGLAVIRKRFRK